MPALRGSLVVIAGVFCGISAPVRADDGPSARLTRILFDLLAEEPPSVQLAAFTPETWGGEIPPVSAYAGFQVVIACTFKTPDAEPLAREVAAELRLTLGRATYLHRIRDQHREGVSVIVAVHSGEDAADIRNRVAAIEPRCLAETSEPKRLRRAKYAAFPFDRNPVRLTGDFPG